MQDNKRKLFFFINLYYRTQSNSTIDLFQHVVQRKKNSQDFSLQHYNLTWL